MSIKFKYIGLPVLGLGLLGLSGGVTPADAGWKPSQNVEISTTCKAGCGPDRIARMLQKIWKKEKLVDADVIVHNKAGGGGGIQLGYIDAHRGDGHYLGIASASALSTYLTGRTKIGLHQMTPLVVMGQAYISTAVKGDSPYKDGKALLAQMKKDPKSVAIGTATSRGNSNHMAISLAALKYGIDPGALKFVIFQSGRIGRTNLLGGHVDAAQSSIGGFIKHHKKGKLRIVAVAAPERLGGAAKNIPTWRELGVDAVVANFRGVFGPKGMSADMIAYWEGVLRKTVESKEWKGFAKKRMLAGKFMGHKAFVKFKDEKDAQMRVVLKALGLLKR
jgi:putative tricarboxylic transport membrane protein